MAGETIETIFQKYSAVNTHMGTDKITSHSYGTVYNYLFSIVQGTKRVLEVGFDGGASLLSYADYFPEATIYGIDIEDHRLPPVKTHPRIQTYIGDATKKETIDHFNQTYDLLIEDASHLLHHQIQHFRDYSRFVNPGGLYIIEDVHEENVAALQKDLCEYAKENGFEFYLYDLRPIKGRFDDILFVFQKKSTYTTSCDSFLAKIRSLSEGDLVALIEPIQTLLSRSSFANGSLKMSFQRWFLTPKEKEAAIFFRRIYELDDWRKFCESIFAILA
jgi:cephalosporin hydroxylase